MKVLMIDVGGTHVKLMASGHEGYRKIPSGPKLSAATMVRKVKEALEGWDYEAVTIGFPGVVSNGKLVHEPYNLGGGWLKHDFKKSLKAPVRFINDAAMQALANYEKGRMLFLGLGTSTGCAIVVDDVVVPMEVGRLRLSSGRQFLEELNKEALKRRGRKKWLASVHEAVNILQDLFTPDDTVLGGGNSKEVDPLPKGCRQRHNQTAFLGALRLWPGADMYAESYGSSWRIVQRKKK